MLGYEPPQPKLWKAVVAAGVVTFPFLYVADVAITGHRPGWLYALGATVITLLIGRQMYRKGTGSLRRIPIGVPISRVWGGSSWQQPEKHQAKDTD